MNAYSENRSIETTQESPSTKKRFRLFLGTYLIGIIIVMGIFTLHGRTNPLEKDDLLLYFIVFIGLIIALPGAVFMPLSLAGILKIEFTLGDGGFDAGAPWVFLSYLLFLSIIWLGISTKKRRTFRVFYYIFLGFMISIIAGCAGTMS